MRRWTRPKRKPPQCLPAKVCSCLLSPCLVFYVSSAARTRSNPEFSFDWIARPLKVSAFGQPEISSVSGLHLMSIQVEAPCSVFALAPQPTNHLTYVLHLGCCYNH